MTSGIGVIERLIDYVSSARAAELPPEVLRRAKHHILDTFASMISGSRIKPGQMALKYARLHQDGAREAQVVASDMVLPLIPAAIANGMLGHSDETDDSNGTTGGLHPGCSILPASLGMAEREDASGADVVNAVVLGYDIAGRTNKALGRDAIRARNHLPFSLGGTLGAAAAAGCLAGFTRPDQYRFLFSYAAQQASGVNTYARDTEHIEKAFIFGGMPARNGLTAATLIQMGFTGVWDVFSGDGNFLVAFADKPDPEELVAELGSRFEVMLTNIKKYCVGFPIQAALEALLLLRDEHRFGAADVERIVARLPRSGAHTVNDREMPNINLQYNFAIALLDGSVSFEAAHDVERMTEPSVRELRARVSLVGDPELASGEHGAIVEVALKDGRTVTQRVDTFRGKAEAPLTTDEVEAKAKNLIEPVMGAEQTRRLIETVRDLEQVPKARDLRPLLALGPR